MPQDKESPKDEAGTRNPKPPPPRWTETEWRGHKLLSCVAESCRFNTFDLVEMKAHQEALHGEGVSR